MNKFKSGTKGKLGVIEGDVYQWTDEELRDYNTASIEAQQDDQLEVRVRVYGTQRHVYAQHKAERCTQYLVKLYNGRYLSHLSVISGDYKADFNAIGQARAKILSRAGAERLAFLYKADVVHVVRLY